MKEKHLRKALAAAFLLTTSAGLLLHGQETQPYQGKVDLFSFPFS
jgi:hypothetical protein